MNSGHNRKRFWNKYHRWAGLIVSVFILVFCFSGIILNHRSTFGSADISRSFLPPSYKIQNFNNGVIKGTLSVGGDSLLAYGSCGVWLTDRNFSQTSDFNRGFPKGVDNRNIRSIVRSKTGEVWCAAQFGLFRLDGNIWTEIPLPGNHERLADVTLAPDSIGIVAVTRSSLYVTDDNGSFRETRIPAPAGYEKKVSLFKTIWQLHSGELFGITGKLIVDLIAVILAFLCITGIILFILPYTMREQVRRHIAEIKGKASFLWNLKWHKKIGYFTLPLVLLTVFTGTCLRPPLMIPFVLTKSAPVPGSNLDSDNPWHDKLRALRHDANNHEWLLSTSEGFFRLSDLTAVPVAIDKTSAPPLSPMGITVFCPDRDSLWLVGSFSGLYRWNPATGYFEDYFTGKQPDTSKKRPFVLSDHLVSGYTSDTPRPVVFDYAKGADVNMPSCAVIERQPMSLWNFALELHTGRCYSSFLGPLSDLFVFISGLLTLLILISGYIVHKRHKKSPRPSRRERG